MNEELDWNEAEKRLKIAEEAYTEIGSSGRFAMQFVINPARDRFNKGERTKHLYDEIFGIAL